MKLRKWALAAPPPLQDKNCEEIRQGYFITGASEMRVRRDGARCTLAVQNGRDLWETAIDDWVFDAVWQATKGRRIRKRRYTWREKRHTMQLDVYEGKLEGLLILEVGFRSSKSRDDFMLPEWAAGAIEVTDDAAFRNEALALHGLDRIKETLSMR